MKFIYSLAALAVAGTMALSAQAAAPWTYEAGDYVQESNKAYKLIGENLISNGDFSDGLTGWTSVGGVQITSSNFEIAEEDGPQGGRALKALGGGGSGDAHSIRRNISLEAGKTYFAHYWYKNLNPASDNYKYSTFELCDGNDGTTKVGNLTGANSGNKKTAGVDRWNSAYAVFTVPEGATVLHIRCAWLQNGSEFADFELYEVEETTEMPVLTAENGPMDITAFKIMNHDFENGTNNWTVENMGIQQNGETVQIHHNYPERYEAQNYASIGVKQTVKGLNKGKYRLNAFALNAQGNASADDNVYIFAGENQTRVFEYGNYSVEFEVFTDNSDVEIGFASKNTKGRWNACDFFQLFYIGEVETVAEMTLNIDVKDVDGNAVEGASVKANKEVEAVSTDAEGKAVVALTSEQIEDLSAEVSKDGYYTKNVEVNFGASTEANVTVTLLKAGDNLMYNALEGKTGSVPANWVCYNREGSAVSHPGNATLRDENGGTNADNEPYVYFPRWDGDSESVFNVYYTYPVEIPETGVYEFSLSYTQNGSWSEGHGNNGMSHVGATNRLQVALTSEPGYRYTDTQVFYLSSDGNHADFYSNANEPIRFFAEKGTHYLSFVGSRALWRVKDMEFKLADNSVTELHLFEAAELIGHYDENSFDEENPEFMAFFGGVRFEKLAEENEMSYVFVKDGDNSIQTYAPYDNRNFTEDGTLYLTHRVNGVNSQVLKQQIAIKGIELPAQHLLIDEDFYDFSIGKTVNIPSDGSKNIWFHLTVPYDIYYQFVEETPQAPGEDNEEKVEMRIAEDNNHEGFTKFDRYGDEIVINKSGKLSYYPAFNGVKGDVKTVEFSLETGVSEVGVEAGEAEYYTLDGVKVAKAGLEKGIYVVRQGGKTFKAVVK